MKRIAYAEDESDTREDFVCAFRDVLRKYGIEAEIDEFDNGRDLVDAVQKGNYGLAFTDNMMPGMSGLKAIIEIRKTHPDLPLYMLHTGDKQIEEIAMKERATGYISTIKIDMLDKIEDAIVKHLKD